MKIKLIVLLVFAFLSRVNAVNVTIIESQSSANWAVQDTVWRTVANGMGFSATIVPQSTLDNISNLNSTDILIVASGILSFGNSNHLQTIKQFVFSGRPAYIQSEYLGTFQGNITFDSLMHAVGADFSWIGTVSGELIPMTILGTFSTTPNNVSILNYFHYGYSGKSSELEKFLKYYENYFGFCYTDTTGSKGTIITTSDEDWLWTNSSPALMENILYRLVQSTPYSINSYLTTNSFINISPNPFKTKTTIRTDKILQDATLTVYNSFGQQVKQLKNITGQEITLRQDNLSSGLYIVRLTKNNMVIASEKLIIID